MDQAGKAACAASTILMASCLEAAEDFQITLLVIGDVTSKVVSVVISWPLMRRGTVWLKASLDRWDAWPLVPLDAMVGAV